MQPGTQDGRVVGKREGRQLVYREEAHVLTLASNLDAAAGHPAAISDEDHALAWGRVGAQQPLNAHIETGLFLRFADGRLLQHFAGIDEAGGERPLADVRLLIALDEEQPASALGEHADGDLRVAEVDVAALRADEPPLAEDLAATQRRPALGAEMGQQEWWTSARG